MNRIIEQPNSQLFLESFLSINPLYFRNLRFLSTAVSLIPNFIPNFIPNLVNPIERYFITMEFSLNTYASLPYDLIIFGTPLPDCSLICSFNKIFVKICYISFQICYKIQKKCYMVTTILPSTPFSCALIAALISLNL